MDRKRRSAIDPTSCRPIKRAQRCPCYFIRAIRGWRRKKTTQTDIFALQASLFAVLLLLLATCLATSAEERNEWDRSKAIAKFLLHGPTSDRTVGDRSACGLSGHGARTTG